MVVVAVLTTYPAARRVPRARQDVHDALHLVEHAGSLDAGFGCLPDQRYPFAQRVEHSAALHGCDALVVEALDQLGRVLEVVQQRAPSRFGRVSRQDGMDLEVADCLFDLIWLDAL